MKFKVKLVLFLLFLSLFLVTAKNTYARYAAASTGIAQLDMAQWQISVNNQNITENYNTQLSFTPIIEENKNVKAGTVAPGTTGYFDIQINPEKVDVSFSYDIMLQLPDNVAVSDLKITYYSIVQQGQSADETEKIPFTGTAIKNVLTYDNSTPDFKFSPFIVRIYFEWYDGSDNLMDDTEDTKVGQMAAESEELNFNILASISFKQFTD